LYETYFRRFEDTDLPSRFVYGDGHEGVVVVERPQQDERTRSIPPEVLAHLSWAGAALAYRYAGMLGCPVVEYTPTQWKGSVPKPVHHGLLWKVLSAGERSCLGGAATLAQINRAKEKGALDRWKKAGGDYYPESWLVHNLLDAACLGAFHLGRIGK
jgi:hypothetical protein